MPYGFCLDEVIVAFDLYSPCDTIFVCEDVDTIVFTKCSMKTPLLGVFGKRRGRGGLRLDPVDRSAVVFATELAF